MNDEPLLAKGYAWDVIRTDGGVALPMIVPLAEEDRRRWLLHMAPPECFADPAPAPDEALKAGEMVYVDCPRTGRRGWAGVRHTPFWVREASEISVRFKRDNRCHAVLRAACHREGPQGPPPAEGAVFLGRYPYGPRKALRDGWYSSGRICFETAFEHGVKVEDIYVQGSNYFAALPTARALGLVDAVAEPEPERPFSDVAADIIADGYEATKRPEQRFVKGQMTETASGLAGRIVQVEWIAHPASGDVPYWQYLCNGYWYSEAHLKPHTMTVADVPDEVLVAIMRGRPVRVVDVPVHESGRPYTFANDCDTSTVRYAGQPVTPDRLGLDQHGRVDIEETGGMIQVWNLEPATDSAAETDA